MSRAIQQNRRTRPVSAAQWSVSRLVYYGLALGMGVGLCLVWLLPGAGGLHYWKMIQELEQTKADIAELKRANAAFRKEIRLAKSDPFTLERLARERLGYVREGETVYQFVESP
ncbi:MAG: septum formation initiator family protein [Nitrospira sp.]|nr:septum formation initiator family protein [Nitrospira sp.]